jgi:hypothetical protein
VSQRELNRWTLARQLLMERADLDAVGAIERLAGMQAQYSPSPYVGLWSRLRGFRREELEADLMEGRVVKATLMRGTLHLVSARELDCYRVASRYPNHVWTQGLQRLRESGVDVDALREEMLAVLRERPLKKAELQERFRHRIPPELPDWTAFSVLVVVGAVVNAPEDARFGHFAGSRYRPAPPGETSPEAGMRRVVEAYLAAFGPASRGDLAQWLGRPVAAFAEQLDSLDLVAFRSPDGRTLLDLPAAPRPDPGVPAPARFLPKWDNLLLAYTRRERVLPEAHRRTLIRKNGDVLPTFLVDGLVAGWWEAPLRGRASLTLTPLVPLARRARREVEREAWELLAWLRPETDRREVRWAAAP